MGLPLFGAVGERKMSASADRCSDSDNLHGAENGRSFFQCVIWFPSPQVNAELIGSVTLAQQRSSGNPAASSPFARSYTCRMAGCSWHPFNYEGIYQSLRR